MKIIKVEYKRLISDGNFNNQAHGAEALVEDGETPEDARTSLVYWVNSFIQDSHGLSETQKEHDDLSLEIAQLEEQKAELLGDIDAGKERFSWLKNLLEKHGVEIPESLPF